ncbi:hypothetical protein THAOC_34774 [Thalassiosira oceanica]|uniref:sn-1-specific diacylglycerol lipase n=1 Tax=Thalassiosira oceanica TaxID=159749 RepID=K0RBS5_THAOC|nr:hypothetical protein THAOC_34774 [Thalassiosira oceanica]|eukprot:EJK46551.1 hypothetical protein THAOC_34774 [Thalassiosira oceanica]
MANPAPSTILLRPMKHPLQTTKSDKMPALVVYERLIVAGDDLRLLSAITLVLRLLQIVVTVVVVHGVMVFDHRPMVFVLTGCLADEHSYWIWKDISVAAGFAMIVYGFVGAAVEISVFLVSSRGTPVETRARRALVPICKFNLLPMMIIRSLGFVFALVAIRPPKKRTDEDIQQTWEKSCRRCCECSSLLTCYLCGGHKLTAQSYGDVAYALTDFLAGEENLDIVPSDGKINRLSFLFVTWRRGMGIIMCKDALIADDGILAKKSSLASRLWKQFILAESRTNNSMEISPALKRSLSNVQNSSSDDIEAGTPAKDEEDTQFLETSLCLQTDGHNRSIQHLEWVADDREPTANQLESLRNMIIERKDKDTDFLSYRLVRDGDASDFEPRINCVLSPTNKFDCLMLGEGDRYSQVGCRISTALQATYSNFLVLGGFSSVQLDAIRLAAGTIYGKATCRSKNPSVIGDNWCGWKEGALLKTLGIQDCDIIHANFVNGVSITPYIILIDRAWKTVVVTIRGTLSFEDMITGKTCSDPSRFPCQVLNVHFLADVTISPVSLEDIGRRCGFDGNKDYCHSGMLKSAECIYDDILSHKKLHVAMVENPTYGLRVIGHSLGAGVAAVLGLMLRQQFPNLHCLCFSPPGCVFTSGMAAESKKFCCSFVLHDDLVPRLSYDSLAVDRADDHWNARKATAPENKHTKVDHFPFNVASSLKTIADAYGCEAAKLHQEPERLARILRCDEPKKNT